MRKENIEFLLEIQQANPYKAPRYGKMLIFLTKVDDAPAMAYHLFDPDLFNFRG
ncbi:MAG: hypothetical protein ABIN89_04185 [Chitinophagaceae bacterium]